MEKCENIRSMEKCEIKQFGVHCDSLFGNPYISLVWVQVSATTPISEIFKYDNDVFESRLLLLEKTKNLDFLSEKKLHRKRDSNISKAIVKPN